MNKLRTILWVSATLVLLILAACGSDANPTPLLTKAAPVDSTAIAENGRTQLVSEGYSFTLQFACLVRTLPQCQHMESFYAPMVSERTNGQVEIQISSFSELEVAGTDSLQLAERGTLEFIEVYSGFVGGTLPVLDVGLLSSLGGDGSATQKALIAAADDLDQAVSEATGGGVVLVKNWYLDDQFFWSKVPLRTPDDFNGLKIFPNNQVFKDLIEGLGGQGLFITYRDVYSALESGALDAAVSCGDCGIGPGWYRETGYLVGPLSANIYTWGVVNRELWDRMPPDIQQLLLEVGEEYEREIIVQAQIWALAAVPTAQSNGMEFIEFTPQVTEAIFEVGKELMLPSWVERTGGPDSEGSRIWNEHFADLIGLRIEAHGSVVEVPTIQR